MRDSATRLGAAGFPVFPVKGKTPLVKEWQHNATTDSKQIASWAAQFPGCNWGVHCADLLVLDVDPKNQGAIPDGLPVTFKVRTQSGGYHYYFRHSGGVKNSSGKVGQGLDIRSNNGYVVAPGSVINGKEYVIVDRSPPAEAPKWLVEAAGRPVPRTKSNGNSDGDQGAAVQRAVQVMTDHPPAVQGEGGDHKTFAAVCKVRDMGVDASHALEALTLWNERCEPPWEPDDLQVKINNAYSYASNAVGNAVALDSDFEPTLAFILGECSEKSTIPEQAHDNIGDGSNVSVTDDIVECNQPVTSLLSTAPDIDVGALLATDYLIKGWLPSESNALMFGEWGGGKTFNALHMAAHIAAGVPWFDLRVHQGGVLYVGYEGARGISCRVQALRLEYPDFPWDDMPLAWFMLNRPLVNGGEGQKLLGDAFREFKNKYGRLPSLVIIDPLRDALGGSDSDADLTAPYLKYVREMVKRMKCTVLTIHHPGHGDKERGRGDSGIEASMDTVIRLDKDAGTIETKKQRDGASRRFNYALKLVDIGTDADGDLVQSCVVEKIDDNPNDPKLTNTQQRAMDALRGLTDDDGYLTASAVKDALPKSDASARRGLLRTLVLKGHLLAEGSGWQMALPGSGTDIFR